MSDIETLQNQLTEQGKTLNQIRDALLGSLDGSSVGLISDHRALKLQVQANTTKIAEQDADIDKLKEFRRDIKKVVGFVAFAIPLLFEIVKGLCVLGWEYFKNGLHK